MNVSFSRLFVPALFALAVSSSHAAIDAPDHVIYGNVTVFGAPADFGTVIELRAHPSGAVLTRYVLGRDPNLGNQFALRIPMDAVDPRRAGFARPGDPVRIFVASQLAAETSVGGEGLTVRLDLDPQSLGTGPSVAVADQSRFEGNAATQVMNFPVQMNTTSADLVSVEWATRNGTATGGASCMAGVDYVIDTGVVQLPAQSLASSLPVLICGDTLVEPDETFFVDLTRVVNGVLTRSSVMGTLLDDDDVPVLSVANTRVLEPTVGQAMAMFKPRLSRSSPVPVTFTYSTQDINAIAGADYIATSGSGSIAAGELETTILVPILADSPVEADESFRLVLANPTQATLPQPIALGTISDPRFDPSIEHENDADNGDTGLADLLQPSDVALSPDGRHAYASSESGDSVLQFERQSNGDLVIVRTYKSSTAGFAQANFDGARDLRMSAGGDFLYVGARDGNAITVLARNAGSGDLTFVQTQTHNQVDATAAGGTVLGLSGVAALDLSPDGAHLYAVGSMSNTLAVFERDQATGRLRFLEAETNGVNDASDNGPAVVALDRPAGLVVSGDGAQVYVAARFGDALLVFDRTTAAGANFGKLSYRTAYRDGLLGIEGLDGAFALTLSSDGLHLYAVSEADSAVVLFDRTADGALTRRKQWSKGDTGITGLGGAQAVALSPDGSELFVTGFADHSLTVFTRALADAGSVLAGDLQVRQTVFDNEGPVQNMAGPVAITVSGDARHVYVAAHTDNAVVRFRRLVTDPVFGDGFE